MKNRGRPTQSPRSDWSSKNSVTNSRSLTGLAIQSAICLARQYLIGCHKRADSHLKQDHQAVHTLIGVAIV